MNTDTETFTCRDCGESYPRAGFGKGKTRNTRCVGVDTNGCDSKYRKAKRDAKRVAVPRAEVSMASVIEEMSQTSKRRKRYLVDHLSADEKAERKTMRKWIHKIIEKFPDYQRELNELTVVKQIAEEFGVCPSGYSYSLREGHWLSLKRHFTPELDTPGWPGWRRRYQWLLERTEWMPQVLVERAFANEQERVLDPYAADYDLPSEKEPMLERLASRMWNVYLSETRERRRAKALITPTYEELAAEMVLRDYVKSGNDAEVIAALSSAHICQMKYEATHDKGDSRRAESKLNAADDCLVHAEEAAFNRAIDYRIDELRSSGTGPLTWAEAIPEVYGPEAIEAYGIPTPPTITHRQAVKKAEQERLEVLDQLDNKYIILSPEDLKNLRIWAIKCQENSG